MMKRLLFTLLFGLGLYGFALAQGRDISGRVTDAKGEGIPGASVLIKGTTTGTSTDLDGNFKLKVGSDLDVLVFSGVGLATKEVLVGSQSSISMTMEEDVKVLDKEVVVTSYREFTREQAVSTISTVDKKLIENVPMGSFDQILQGRVPGALISTNSGQPGAPANVRIRGIGSINASVQPLYIVDGVAISAGDFATINANDFERVDVLKDAAATSQYGSRGANGVIVITTKRGSKNMPAEITYRLQQGWTMRTQPRFNMMNTEEKIRFERLLYSQQGNANGGRVTAILAGAGTPEQKEAAISDLAQTNSDWSNFVFRVGKMTSHEVSARGGNDKTQYYIAGNYRKEEGILMASALERYNLRFNLDQQLTSKLKLSLSTTLGFSTQTRVNAEGSETAATTGGFLTANPIFHAYLNNPYTTPVGPSGNLLPTPFPQTQGGFLGNGNILGANTDYSRIENQLKFIGSAALTYQLRSDLSISTKVGIDYGNNQNKEVTRGDFAFNFYNAPFNSGFATFEFFRGQILTNTTLLRYTKTFARKHTINAYAGNEIVLENGFYMGQRGLRLNPRLDFPTPNPTNLNEITIASNEYRNNLVSFFGEVAYTFDSRYNVTVSYRRDGSSRFGQDKRFANFVSGGVSWNMHNESFMKSLENTITTAIFRVNYGTVGNQEFGGSDATNFRYFATYGQTGGYNGVAGTGPTSVPNPALGWEKSTSLGIGMDLGLFKDRLFLTVDYYDKKTSDLLLAKQISATTGFTSVFSNVGSLRNRGIEIRLRADIIKNEKFNWNFDANFTYNINKVENLGGLDQLPTTALGQTGGSVIKVGYPVQTFFLIPWAGVDRTNGNAQYLTPDGTITNTLSASNQRVIEGAFAQPPYFGGFTNTFTINKNLEISFFFTYAFGNKMINRPRAAAQVFAAAAGNLPYNKDRELLSMWLPGNTANNATTNIPSPIGQGIPTTNGQAWLSTRYLEDGAFMRLRNVRVGYTFDGETIKRAKISRLTVYAQAQNMLTFTNFKGFDPENSTPQDTGNFPVPRVFNLGADITF